MVKRAVVDRLREAFSAEWPREELNLPLNEVVDLLNQATDYMLIKSENFKLTKLQ